MSRPPLASVPFRRATSLVSFPALLAAALAIGTACPAPTPSQPLPSEICFDDAEVLRGALTLIAGRITRDGSPAPAALLGNLRFENSYGESTNVNVDDDGRFDVTLSNGTYQAILSARSTSTFITLASDLLVGPGGVEAVRMAAELELEIPTGTVEGRLTIDGVVPPDDIQGRGFVEWRATETDVSTFPVGVSYGAVDVDGSYTVELLPGTYNVRYLRGTHRAAVDAFTEVPVGVVDLGQRTIDGATTFDFNIDRSITDDAVDIGGEVVVNGASLADLDINRSRGFIDFGEGLSVSLGTTGPATWRLRVWKGVIHPRLFITGAVLPEDIERVNTMELCRDGCDVEADTTFNVDLADNPPSAEPDLNLSIRLIGTDGEEVLEDHDVFLEVRDEAGAIRSVGNTDGQVLTLKSFNPGNYQVRVRGGQTIHGTLLEAIPFVMEDGDTNVVIDIPVVRLDLTLTANGQQLPNIDGGSRASVSLQPTATDMQEFFIRGAEEDVGPIGDARVSMLTIPGEYNVFVRTFTLGGRDSFIVPLEQETFPLGLGIVDRILVNDDDVLTVDAQTTTMSAVIDLAAVTIPDGQIPMVRLRNDGGEVLWTEANQSGETLLPAYRGGCYDVDVVPLRPQDRPDTSFNVGVSFGRLCHCAQRPSRV